MKLYTHTCPCCDRKFKDDDPEGCYLCPECAENAMKEIINSEQEANKARSNQYGKRRKQEE